MRCVGKLGQHGLWLGKGLDCLAESNRLDPCPVTGDHYIDTEAGQIYLLASVENAKTERESRAWIQLEFPRGEV